MYLRVCGPLATGTAGAAAAGAASPSAKSSSEPSTSIRHESSEGRSAAGSDEANEAVEDEMPYVAPSCVRQYGIATQGVLFFCRHAYRRRGNVVQRKVERARVPVRVLRPTPASVPLPRGHECADRRPAGGRTTPAAKSASEYEIRNNLLLKKK